MTNVKAIILLQIKEILDEYINESAQCYTLWNEKHNFGLSEKGLNFVRTFNETVALISDVLFYN